MTVAQRANSPWWRRPSPVSLADEPVADAHLEEALSLLEGALRADDSVTVVWDARGDVVVEHLPEPELRDSSVGATQLARALADAKGAALSGRWSDDIVSIFGPPRRELVVHARPILKQSEEHGSVIIGAVARVEDVSAQRRVEEVRRDFVANISHELRTPVGAIGVLAEMIVGEQSPEVVARLASRMDIEAGRLSRMVDELLALAQIEAGEDVPRQPVDVRSAVDAAVERVTPGAQLRGIAIEVDEVSGAHHAIVLGERGQLISAVHNLLDNAVKYSDDGLPVTVRIDAASVPGEVELAVIDHGVGIPLRDRERIFERFYRVDRARTRETGGIGLGLAIVRHVAANLGGRVEVSSIEGQGSTFTMHLPAAPAGEQQ